LGKRNGLPTTFLIHTGCLYPYLPQEKNLCKDHIQRWGESLNEISKSYYNLKIERDYLKLRGNEFQNWFADIMEHCHPGDFIRVRPWGSCGDEKCDGYLQSSKMIFQCYAPNEMKAAEAIDKITEDFTGAKKHWSDKMDCWTFVHNARDGLSPIIVKELISLQKNNHPLIVGHWGYVEIYTRIFTMLRNEDFVSLFGPAPSHDAMKKVGYGELKVVLDIIKKRSPALDEVIHEPPADKIKINALSDDVEALLKLGFRKSAQVGKFFRDWHDPTLGDSIASAFKEEYEKLRAGGLPPDEIFGGLQEFAGGAMRGAPEHESAVLAVLAYLFEECDIFERERPNDSTNQASQR
jgi:hypothetical protein